jgi:hypothetical protein
MTRRSRINRVTTSARKWMTSTMSRQVYRIRTDTVQLGTCELDLHADTCVAGPNTVVIEYTDQAVSISAFTNQLDVIKDIPIGTVATAYDDPRDGNTIILIIHQALLMHDIVESTLLCPNQLWSNGLVVDDVPLHLSPINHPSTHSIYLPDDDIRLPLELVGVISVLPTRTPTQVELDTCRWVNLTSDASWNPHSPDFQANETIASTNPVTKERILCSAITGHHCNSELALISSALDYTPSNISAITTTSSRRSRVSPELLSQRWGIGLDIAKDTLKVTTQKGIRQVAGPIERRLRT